MSQFPFTPPATMAVMLLALTTILAVTYAEEFDEAYYNRLPSGYSYGYLQTNRSEKFYKSKSLLQCSFLALNSQSEFFTYNKFNHLCKNYSPDDITNVSTNDNNEISFYRRGQWIKTYAISKGANSLVYYSFVNYGNPSTWNVDNCIGDYCPNFFRHPILDFWNHLPIDEVKLVIYKNQEESVTLIFNGRNTTLESWFSQENLKSSPWDDLASATDVKFSLVGFDNNRRFYITKHDSCHGDNGWLTINEGSLYCSYESTDHYPSIRYSDTNSKVIWNDGYALADSIAIFIRLK